MKLNRGSFPRRKRKKTRSNKELIDLCLRKFKRIYKQEADCINHIVLSLGPVGRTCRHCHSVRVSRRYGQRVLRCLSCHRRTWILATTFFSRVKRVRPWLMAIWLLEYGVRLCASELARRARIADSSAQAIVKKLGMLMHHVMGTNAELVASLRFVAVFSRRSSQTPAMEHPAAEKDTVCAEHPAHFRTACGGDGSSRVFDESTQAMQQEQTQDETLAQLKQEDDLVLSQLNGAEKDVYEMLGDQPLYVDVLLERLMMPVRNLNVVLLNLELAGVAKRVAGDCYVRRRPESVPSTIQPTPLLEMKEESGPNLTECLDFIRRTFGGISRKYLQIYLGSYWCYADRALWSGGRLFSECLSYGPLLFKRIRKFISPQMVQLVAAPLHGATFAQLAS